MIHGDATVGHPIGRIELICGCMFSGKSERLIERIRQARAAGRAVAVFKHADDDRYDPVDIVTHSGWRETAQRAASWEGILEKAGEAELIAIDEGQFFDADLPRICQELTRKGRDVVVAGLDRNAWGNPFGPISQIERLAHVVTRLEARCARCGVPATHTQRTAPLRDDQRLVGGSESYEPRCRRCFEPPPVP